jgi:hypothetical protein
MVTDKKLNVVKTARPCFLPFRPEFVSSGNTPRPSADLPLKAAAQLAQYAYRLQQRSEKVISLKLTGLAD